MNNYGKAACRTLAFAITACAAMALLVASQKSPIEVRRLPAAATLSSAVVCRVPEAAQRAIGRDGHLWRTDEVERLATDAPSNRESTGAVEIEITSSEAGDERTIRFSVSGVPHEAASRTVDHVNWLAENHAALCRDRIKAIADQATHEASEEIERARSSVTSAEEAMSYALDQLIVARAEHAARVANANSQPTQSEAAQRPNLPESDQEYAGLAENLRRLRAHRTDLIGKLTAAHPMVVEVDHQIEVAVDAISAFAARQTTRAAAHAAKVAQQSEARRSLAASQIKRQIDNAAAAEAKALAEYQQGRADWQCARSAYEASLARQRLAVEQAGALAQIDVSVRRASAPAESQHAAAAPSTSRWLPWPACLSLAIGAAVAWGVGVENIETYRSAGELERSLGVPVLGLVAQIRSDSTANARQSWAPALCWGIVAGGAGILFIACLTSLTPLAATALDMADQLRREHASVPALVVDALSGLAAR